MHFSRFAVRVIALAPVDSLFRPDVLPRAIVQRGPFSKQTFPRSFRAHVIFSRKEERAALLVLTRLRFLKIYFSRRKRIVEIALCDTSCPSYHVRRPVLAVVSERVVVPVRMFGELYSSFQLFAQHAQIV